MSVLFKGPKKQRRTAPDDPEEFRLTLVEHLEDLRNTLIRCICILAASWFVGWELTKPLYQSMTDRMTIAIKMVLPPGVTYTEAFFHGPDAFLIKLKLSFFIGLIPAFPLLMLQLWKFIEPALKPSERAPVRKVAPYTLILFATGAGFAWWIMPAAMRWFASYVMEFPHTNVVQEAGTLAFFVLKMMLAFGIAFQLPLVVYILGAIGLLKAETLLANWRQAATAIFVISMIVTPSNDPATMLMMAIPLVILFAISVWAVKVTQKRRRAADIAAGIEPEDDLE